MLILGCFSLGCTARQSIFDSVRFQLSTCRDRDAPSRRTCLGTLRRWREVLKWNKKAQWGFELKPSNALPLELPPLLLVTRTLAFCFLSLESIRQIGRSEHLYCAIIRQLWQWLVASLSHRKLNPGEVNLLFWQWIVVDVVVVFAVAFAVVAVDVVVMVPQRCL